jgi:hypothetical protein
VPQAEIAKGGDIVQGTLRNVDPLGLLFATTSGPRLGGTC